VMTSMPAGLPKISADSKLSTPRMNERMKALVVTGSMRPSVTRRKVVQDVAPDMRLDSSSEGSIARKASTINRNRNGVEYCIMCQTTPP
jgi:hypothetical protein